MLARSASAMRSAAGGLWPEPAERNAEGSAARASLRHQFRGIFEGFVLLVAFVAVERVFLGRGTFAGLDVHPFWFPVLLVTLQYGFYSGVVTACLAALMLDWPIRPPGQDIVDFYFELVRLPVQWVLAAMAIGIFRQAQIRAETVRERTIASLRATNERFAEEVARLDDELYRFETAIATTGPGPAAGGEAGVPEALARLAALRTAAADTLGPGFAEAAAAVLGEAPVRLYRAVAKGDYADVSDAPPLGGLAPRLGPDHPLLHPAPGRKRPPGLLALPLQAAGAGRPAGFLVAADPAPDTPGPVWEEGLRLLAAAATAGLAHAASAAADRGA
jgi:hypothetical protein